MSPTDTSPIRPEEAFDEIAVASYLGRHLSGLVGRKIVTFDQFPGGKANLTYRASADGVELVLRRAPLGEVARGGHDMQREFRVLSRLWREYPLAPQAYHYCADPAVMGKPFFVMERRHGHVPRDSWPASWPEHATLLRTTAARSLVAAVGDLHRIDPAAVGLDDFGHPEGFVERQLAGWAQRWEAARTRDVADMDLALALLSSDVPLPQAACVLHNDFKLDNTMLGDDGHLVAVFDWDMSTIGDPLMDIGTMLAYWAQPGAATYPILGGSEAVTPAPYLSRDDLLQQYATATGFELSRIRFYEGLALYRITVIIEQIYARYAAGQTTDHRFSAFESLPPILARAAVDVLSGPS